MIVIFLAYYTTIFIAKKSTNMLKNKHAKVIERTNLGLNLSILVIQIHNKIYILLQYYKEVELLDVIDENQWEVYRQAEVSLNDENNRMRGQISGLNMISRMFNSKRDDAKGDNHKKHRK